VSLGGVDSRTIAQSDLRRRVGWVPHIFNASVRDNLTLFKPGIPDEGLLRTLEDLGLGDWLRTLPHGLDTELSPGDSLSAGESQILALARVFLKDPGLVILDEASSRLDPATEYLVQRAIKTLLSGRTGIIIAHRLATLEQVDEILLLENARIREHGTRSQLANDPESVFSHLLRVGIQEEIA